MTCKVAFFPPLYALLYHFLFLFPGSPHGLSTFPASFSPSQSPINLPLPPSCFPLPHLPFPQYPPCKKHLPKLLWCLPVQAQSHGDHCQGQAQWCSGRHHWAKLRKMGSQHLTVPVKSSSITGYNRGGRQLFNALSPFPAFTSGFG